MEGGREAGKGVTKGSMEGDFWSLTLYWSGILFKFCIYESMEGGREAGKGVTKGSIEGEKKVAKDLPREFKKVE